MHTDSEAMEEGEEGWGVNLGVLDTHGQDGLELNVNGMRG